jgi:hypothetical protein
VYKWAPETFGKLYVEGDDLSSLTFWHKRAKEYLEEIKKSGKISV